MKRSNGFHSIGMTDPRRELADSLPLCHPNDDYLKDFTPMMGKCSQYVPYFCSKLTVCFIFITMRQCTMISNHRPRPMFKKVC